MKLYIGNCSRQHVDFTYRLPESNGVRNQHIPVGGQIQVTGELTTPDLEAVLSQHAKYGLVNVDAIDRTKPFIGMCYSIDRPIAVSKLQKAMVHNTEVLVEQGKKLRQDAALTESAHLQDQLEESGRPEGLRKVEMSIQEENADERPDTVPISEGYRVEPIASQDGPPRRKRGKGSSRASAS